MADTILKFDFSDFERVAKNIGAFADQIPFALAGALNAAAEVARTDLITKTWPSSVEVRNKSFMKAALTTKGERATKKKLSVAVYDKLGRGNLKAHDKGGTARAAKGVLAVPSRAISERRTAKGVPTRLKPLALPRSFRKGDTIYQRPVKRTQPLKLMYTLKSSTHVPADVPFEHDFENSMRREISKAFVPRLIAAMRTRLERK